MSWKEVNETDHQLIEDGRCRVRIYKQYNTSVVWYCIVYLNPEARVCTDDIEFLVPLSKPLEAIKVACEQFLALTEYETPESKKID